MRFLIKLFLSLRRRPKEFQLRLYDEIGRQIYPKP